MSFQEVADQSAAYAIRVMELERLLRECEATLAMWADVAPAVSLRADIRRTLRLPQTAAGSPPDRIELAA